MNVYTRPLFRQAGGPAQPMAQDMSQEIERVAGQLNYLNTMIAVEPNMSTKRQLMEAIQNLAQTTPPEVFNAASKLVRDAKASRSPDVMANPNMAPVNRANGGEIMPPAMQQGMAPPPEAAMLERAEMMASQQAEQLGSQYAQDMMQNVNSAESAEDLINAMRGNQMPLEARREELGGLVGMEDANATPESVLALVQPVIMMTEEGAINSGIGELMQGIISDVEMTTEGGMPTEMGQGVGGLMMAGAQEAPAPQNFNQGGAVQSYALGGIAMPSAFAPMLDSGQDDSFQQDLLQPIEVTATRREPLPTDQGESASEMLLSGSGFGDSVKGYYNEMLPLYQEILGQTEDQKSYNKAQAYFDLAQAGLALASGTDPRTGKSVAGQPFGAQLATAASALPAAFQARAAEQRKLEQGVKSAALQSGLQRAQTKEKFNQELALALAKRTGKSPDLRNLVNKDGEILRVLDLNDPDDLAVAKVAPSKGLMVQTLPTTEKPDLQNVSILYTNNRTVLAQTDDDGKTFILGDGTRVKRNELENVESIVTVSGDEGANVQAKSARVGRFQKLLEDYEKGSYDKTDVSLRNGITALEDRASSAKELDVSPEQLNRSLKYLDADGQEQVLNVIDASLGGLGPVRSLESAFRSVFGFLSDELPPEAKEREMFRQYLRAVGFTGKVALISSPRFPVAEMQLAQQILADPSVAFQDPKVAAENWKVVKRVTDRLRGAYLKALADPLTDNTSAEEAMQGLSRIDTLDALMGPINDLSPSLDSDERFEGTERSGSVFD